MTGTRATGAERAVILQHGESGPPGLLADWAAERGIELEIHRAGEDAQRPELDGQAFIASLGSRHSPQDTHIQEVREELDYIERAVQRDIPVLGLCFGGQVLAKVLGGQVEPAPQPELGWHGIESRRPDLVPEGPWLQWHYLRFTLPPGAELLATSPRAVQAFAQGPHLGVQFHPESTIEIVRGWARADTERLRQAGVSDGEALVERGAPYAERARAAAFQLFDAFLRRARQRERRTS